jgi:hypothetical protein
MFSRQRPVTQLETFAPTTSQDHAVDTPLARVALSDHTTTLPRIRITEKRNIEDESHSQTSKAIRLGGDQSPTRSTGTRGIQRDDQPGVSRSYHAFMTIEQAGSTVIAYEHAFPGRLVAIKRVRPENETSSSHLRTYKSDQVVNMIDTYVDGPEVVFVYEAMDISLRQMISVCPLHVSKLAAIFKEVSSPV